MAFAYTMFGSNSTFRSARHPHIAVENSAAKNNPVNTTFWFPGSAWEPNELQALPAELLFDRRLREAEPPRQRVPRQEPGNERVRGGVQREVSFFSTTLTLEN